MDHTPKDFDSKQMADTLEDLTESTIMRRNGLSTCKSGARRPRQEAKGGSLNRPKRCVLSSQGHSFDSVTAYNCKVNEAIYRKEGKVLMHSWHKVVAA